MGVWNRRGQRLSTCGHRRPTCGQRRPICGQRRPACGQRRPANATGPQRRPFTTTRPAVNAARPTQPGLRSTGPANTAQPTINAAEPAVNAARPARPVAKAARMRSTPAGLRAQVEHILAQSGTATRIGGAKSQRTMPAKARHDGKASASAAQASRRPTAGVAAPEDGASSDATRPSSAPGYRLPMLERRAAEAPRSTQSAKRRLRDMACQTKRVATTDKRRKRTASLFTLIATAAVEGPPGRAPT